TIQVASELLVNSITGGGIGTLPRSINNETVGLNVLCIDGGGVRGVVPLTVLEEIVRATGKQVKVYSRVNLDKILSHSLYVVIAAPPAIRHYLWHLHRRYSSHYARPLEDVRRRM